MLRVDSACDAGEPSWSSLVSDSFERWQIPGVSVAILRGDRVEMKAFGVRDRKTQQPMDPYTTMPIGSLTKTIFAFGVSCAVQEKLISWDQLIAPRLIDAGLPVGGFEGVTLGDLVAMRSGLDASNNWPVWETRSLSEAMRELVAIPFTSRPGEHFIYSGAAIGAAAWLFEQTTGRKWTDYLQSSVFDPLGLSSTTFSHEAASRSANFSLGYEWTKEGPVEKAWPEAARILVSPACSLCSSMRDLARLLPQFLPVSQRLLSESSLRDWMTPRIATHLPDLIFDFYPEYYGYGWGFRSWRGYGMAYHRGSDLGYRALFAVVPERNIALAIQTNLHQTLFPHYLAARLLDHLLGQPEIPWEPVFQTYARQLGSPAPLNSHEYVAR